MTSSKFTRRLINTLLCIIFALIACFFYFFSFELIGWVKNGTKPDAGISFAYGVVLLSPAPFTLIASITLIILLVTKRNWDIFDRAKSSIVLGLIIGLSTAVIAIPSHMLLLRLGIELVPKL